MKTFTKQEWIAIIVILAAIFVASFFNLRLSLIRARDTQRIADADTIVNALAEYNNDFGFYPPSSPDEKDCGL